MEGKTVMKRLLLLGGAIHQIPAIEYAKKRGFHTILCDYLADNPGQYIVDKFYSVSTTDKEAILGVARREKIDGIIAYSSDPAALTAAYVAEALDLPGNPYKSVEILTNKDLIRAYLTDHGFYAPKAKGYDSIELAMNEIKGFSLPVIIKPVDSSGSKGVSKLTDTDDLTTQIGYALTFSRSKRFIIEEFVEKYGYQVTGEGFSVDGKLIFSCFGDVHFNKNDFNPFVPVAASYPSGNPKHIHRKIHAEIQRLLSLLNMKTGAYNFDVRIDKNENVYLMEIGPRSGGNYIPQVIKYASGIDLVEYSIKAALGEDCSKIKMAEPVGFWSFYVINSCKAGVLKDIKINEHIRNNNIMESHIDYEIGDTVPAFINAGGKIGILIMRFRSMDEMLETMKSDDWINVLVE
jgi:biotin carboxylase